MTDHPRSAWVEAAFQITGPAPRRTTTLGVCHWPGGNVNPNTVAYLRQMQRSWVQSRGYSLGYWWYVEQNGDSWQIRGPHNNAGQRFNSAANPGRLQNQGNANDWTAPILFGVNGPALSQAAINTARRLWLSLGTITSNRPVPHSTLDATACCGDAVRAQINAGLLDLNAGPTPPPVIPPPTFPNIPATPIPGASDMFQPVTPFRNSDTRGFGGAGVAANQIATFGVNPSIVPANAVAVAMNVTVVDPQGPGFLTVWPDGSPPPNTSVVNFPGGPGATNGALVCGLVNRNFNLRLNQQAHLVVDITGFWTP